MDVESGLGGGKAVSRRGVPGAAKSFSAGPSAVAPSAGTTSKGASRKKCDIEMRPLLISKGSGKPSNDNTKTASSSASAAHADAAKFADSWLGSMLKMKAKEAEKHAYNLRANLKSKKGFHVQVPKRMLFYTILVFLIGPIVLFLYKENHIHDHDPAYNHVKGHGDNKDALQHNPHDTVHNSNNSAHHNNGHSQQPNHAMRGHANNNNNLNHNKHHAPGHHAPLSQLLAGGMALNHSNSAAPTLPGQHPVLPAGSSENATGTTLPSATTANQLPAISVVEQQGAPDDPSQQASPQEAAAAVDGEQQSLMQQQQEPETQPLPEGISQGQEAAGAGFIPESPELQQQQEGGADAIPDPDAHDVTVHRAVRAQHPGDSASSLRSSNTQGHPDHITHSEERARER